MDQCKAFDRVDHQYLGAVLEAAGLGLDFRRWISAKYSGIKSTVQINGYLSEPFSIKRSVRQGCPLSPLLYVLALKPLLQKLEKLGGNSNEIGCAKSISAYADDITFIVSNEVQLTCVEDAIKGYEVVAGQKLTKASHLRAKSVLPRYVGK
ncbi:secreted RxLR effector protein 78-like [Octopus sinensis]|uniref:Secreted RxLR effector protein 78-like n=1 Tax=Octopus sinensis TaxID=2607531 RepID=A0A7E6EVN2_9MOLL|nr:secreted RxLR effector protein 78-like [Octopus sinensis]